MKIIQITASYKPAYIYGGPIQSVGKLCEALNRFAIISSENPGDELQAQGKECKLNIEVLTTTANGGEELDVQTEHPILVDGVQVTYFKRWTKDHSHFSPGLLSHLRNEILRYKHNDKPIIHIHAWWNLVSVLSCFIAKWYKVPIVLSPRGMLTAYSQNNRNSFSKKLLHTLIGKRLLKHCHIHATSEQEKKDIERIVSPQSITVIPNLVGFEYQESGSMYQEAVSAYQEREVPFRLIFLSRIEEKKGLELLFDALAQLEINWQLTIAGLGNDEYVKRLKDKAESLQVNTRINWIGQVNNDEKYRLMAQHDLLILTSYNENFANVVIESLSVGTPVLISDQVGLSDYVKEKDFGWVTVLNKDNISKEIIRAADDRPKRNRIRESGPARIRMDYSDEVLVERYVEMYQSVIDGHST
ncbi:XrtY-associated glycosyltransferase XYAG1 [Pedobacter frigidisoli]|uniref:XrtY-associated glycosyltransferase XYAG1 n=1 Tax=Pedobacter frigidisoli TaxID=2530455 RepID=UPI00292E0029|nr:glycosyltransferase [Pedobacter frigidisoli]